MGGVVETAVKAAAPIAAGPLGFLGGNMLGEGIANTISNSSNGPQSTSTGALNPKNAGRNVVNGVKGALDAVKQGAVDVGILRAPPEDLNIAAEDPNAISEKDAAARARAKRQAQIDILTDRPGRGGTILTDQYQYKVGP